MPTGRALVLFGVLILFAPVLVGWSWWALAIANAALVGLVALDARRAPGPDRLVIERELPPVVAYRGRARLTWTVDNHSDRRLEVAIADDLAPSLGAERRVRLPVGARGRSTASVELNPQRRGRFDLGAMTVRVPGPLGLGIAQQRRRLDQVLRVLPAHPSRRSAELAAQRSRRGDAGLRLAAGAGEGTEFDELSDYRPDDEHRHIDWSATARAGRPIVRRYRAEQDQSVVILLDAGRIMAATVDGAPRIEHAMDAALSVTTVASAMGDRVGLVVFDRRVRQVIAPGRGAGQVGRIGAALSDVEVRLVESDYRGAFGETVARFRRRCLLVMLTDLVDQAVIDSLVPAMPLIARRHLTMVAAVADPTLDRWRDQPVGGAEDAFRAAAATASRRRRAAAGAALASRGVEVVDAAPGHLATALADRYARLKWTARL